MNDSSQASPSEFASTNNNEVKPHTYGFWWCLWFAVFVQLLAGLTVDASLLFLGSAFPLHSPLDFIAWTLIHAGGFVPLLTYLYSSQYITSLYITNEWLSSALNHASAFGPSILMIIFLAIVFAGISRSKAPGFIPGYLLALLLIVVSVNVIIAAIIESALFFYFAMG